jgi:4-hydroxy-3-methylbut-2-enyl diphosphate reductase
LARAAGKPTYHVETVDELPDDLAHFATVGVTAGASTPNWITNSVIHRLEVIGERSSTGKRLLHCALRSLTDSNIYTGAGAVALTYACFHLQTWSPARLSPLFLIIAFCYIFTAYIWNRMSAPQVAELNPPARVAFYARHPKMLIAITTIFAVSSVVIAARFLGLTETLLLLAAYVIALAYNVPLAPRRLRIRRLKDIPASKDIFTAVAWATVAVVIPAISHASSSMVPVALAAVVALVLAFIRATIFDFTDIQGDRLLGRETLPVLIGPARTKKFLALLTLLLAGVLIGAAAGGAFTGLGFLLLPCPIFIVLVLYPFFGAVVKSELVCPLVADGFLIMAGVIAAAWTAAAGG